MTKFRTPSKLAFHICKHDLVVNVNVIRNPNGTISELFKTFII